MYQTFDFGHILASSARAAWQIEDILPAGAALDFGRRFLPENLARTAALPMLDAREQRILNQIRGHDYLTIFGLVEEFILPFVLDHARPQLSGDDYRVRALLQFAGEEAKHIQLFKRFRQDFEEGFGVYCQVVGPPEEVARAILAHDPLGVAITTLHIEWMVQSHYLDSVKDDKELDPQFKSLLKHHWIEEVQHAKLDTLMVESLAAGRNEEQIMKGVDAYLNIGGFLDGALKQQVEFDLTSFEQASGRELDDYERWEFRQQQLQANRWTYLGSGMTHERVLATLESLTPAARHKVESVSSAFC
jgi:hypothetical protein